MELRRDDVFWSAFTDELEKIAAGRPPNPAQLMKIRAKPRMPSPVPTPAQRPVLPAPSGSTITTGPQQPFVAQPPPNVSTVAPQTSIPLVSRQTNVPPFGTTAPRAASGNMMT